MEETGFPPCVNWNKGHILDCMGSDKVVYGFKQNLVLISWNEDGYQSRVIPCAHDRVNAVAAAPHTAPEPLNRTFVSGGLDGYVKLWNIDTLTLTKAHTSHLSKNSGGTVEVVDISWSRANPNMVASLGKNNCLVSWHIAENVTYKYPLRFINGRAIACCPTNASLIAISDGGVINIIKVSQNSCKAMKFRVFDQEIVDFAWQPNVSKPMMAFTSKRGELAFFNTFEGKRCSKNTKIDLFNQKPNDSNIFICFPLLWVDSATVLTRSANQLISLDVNSIVGLFNGTTENGIENGSSWRSGDIAETNVAANVKNGQEKAKKWRVVHALHRRDFFVLCTPSQGGLVWTVGSDRTIIGYNLADEKSDRFISTLFAGAVCCSVSPHDPNLIAFGGNDGCLRVWNVNQPTGNIYTETRNVQDSVMTVCWHPELENCLHFGTSTGRIGYVDVTKPKPATLLPPASSKSVYWLAWGPPFFPSLEDDKPKYVLYAITNKNLFVYNELVTSNRPHNLGNELLLPNKSFSDLSWKPDFSLLALGTMAGDIYIMKRGCSLPGHILNVRAQVQYLAWHPQMTSTDTQLSPYHNLLTCGSVDPEGVIKVFKIEEEAVGDANAGEEVKQVISSQVFATLKGHHDYIQSVSWSPHLSGQLVSSSADNSIQVWDALTETPLTNHQPTPGSLSLFAIFSPVNSDYIISGSKESAIHIWKLSNKPGKIPILPEKKITKPNVKGCEMAEDKVMPPPKNNKDKKEEPTGNTSVCNNVATLVDTRNPAPHTAVNVWSRNADSFDVCYQLLKTGPSDRETLHSNFLFNSDENVSQKLTELENSHSSAGSENLLASLMLYQGRLKELIEQRIQDGKLNEMLVALAPSVSPRLWQQACIAYARQLRARRRFNDAANYLLACRNLDDAIEALVEGNLFNEALCLARTQLPKEDETFNKILRKYADYLITKGNLAKATECFIYLDDMVELQGCLSRSCDVMALCCAAFIAKHSNNAQLRTDLAITALSTAIQNKLLNVIDIISEDHRDLSAVKLLHNIYTRILLPANDDDKPILEMVSSDISDVDLRECYSHILNTIPKQSTAGVQEKMWNIIQELGLAASASTEVVRNRHVLRALEIAYLQGPNELCSLCQQLSPGLNIDGVFKVENGQGVSLKGFLCLAVLHKSTINLETSPNFLDQIITLQNYLLNELSFDYYRTKTKINTLQTNISKKSSTSKSELELMVSERNQLVLSISKIEIERCVIPNPVAGFMLLRNFYTNLGDNLIGKEQLDSISNQCMPFMK